MFDLFKIQDGKMILEMTGDLKDVKKRQKKLSESFKGKRVRFQIQPSESDEKFKKKPCTRWTNYNKPGPKKVD